MTDGVLSTQPALANLDVWFVDAATANTFWDWVCFGFNTGNDDDIRTAWNNAKGQARGGHFARIDTMATSPGGVGLRRFSDGGQLYPDFLFTGQAGEAGVARDSMGIVIT